jgi:hypothetical protein
LERKDVPRAFLRGFGPPPGREGWFPQDGIVVVFVEVVLVGKMVWFVLTPLSSKWLGTSLTHLELTPVLSRLLALALGFELQVDGPENIWLISGVAAPELAELKKQLGELQ